MSENVQGFAAPTCLFSRLYTSVAPRELQNDAKIRSKYQLITAVMLGIVLNQYKMLIQHLYKHSTHQERDNMQRLIDKSRVQVFVYSVTTRHSHRACRQTSCKLDSLSPAKHLGYQHRPSFSGPSSLITSKLYLSAICNDSKLCLLSFCGSAYSQRAWRHPTRLQ